MPSRRRRRSRWTSWRGISLSASTSLRSVHSRSQMRLLQLGNELRGCSLRWPCRHSWFSSHACAGRLQRQPAPCRSRDLARSCPLRRFADRLLTADTCRSHARRCPQTGSLPKPGRGRPCSTVYGVGGRRPPQMEEQPVALAIYIRSPKSWVIRRGIGRLGAACAGTGELKQRLLELAALDGVFGIRYPSSRHILDAVVVTLPARARPGSPASDHGQGLRVGQTLAQTPQPMQSSGEMARV